MRKRKIARRGANGHPNNKMTNFTYINIRAIEGAVMDAFHAHILCVSFEKKVQN